MATDSNLSARLAIPATEVEIMVKTYYAYSSLHPQFKATTHVKSVWFPIDKITDMAQKLKDENADGLRIYIGRYPADVSAFVDPKPEPNTNSVIFVSTYKQDLDHIDYFTDEQPIAPENRGEQCQPHCGGTIATP